MDLEDLEESSRKLRYASRTVSISVFISHKHDRVRPVKCSSVQTSIKQAQRAC